MPHLPGGHCRGACSVRLHHNPEPPHCSALGDGLCVCESVGDAVETRELDATDEGDDEGDRVLLADEDADGEGVDDCDARVDSDADTVTVAERDAVAEPVEDKEDLGDEEEVDVEDEELLSCWATARATAERQRMSARREAFSIPAQRSGWRDPLRIKGAPAGPPDASETHDKQT